VKVKVNSLTLRRSLAELTARHGVQAARRAVPRAPSTETAMVLTGYASTPDIDDERMRFAPRCFGELPGHLPLLFEHEEPAGTVDALSYTDDGSVRIVCTVTHEAARRCNAFSVAALVRGYELVNTESRDFHAEITAALLTEISLVSVPINPRALVTHRAVAPPPPLVGEFFGLIAQRVACLQKMTAILQKELRA
jgi:hypothetical protein